MQPYAQVEQLSKKSLDSNLRSMKQKQDIRMKLLTSALIVGFGIGFLIYVFHNISKINKLTLELTSVSNKLDTTLNALDQLQTSVGSISKQTRILIDNLPKEDNYLLGDLVRRLSPNEAAYKATRDGDRIDSIFKAHQAFSGKVIIKTKDSSYQGTIHRYNNITTIIVKRDILPQGVIYVNLIDGFLSETTALIDYTPNAVNYTSTVQIEELEVFDI